MSVSARLSMIGGSHLGTSNSNELDANTALLDLEKGIRSSKLGEQCQAIVKFPDFFEKFPFPIIINSGLLKLSDVFRQGSNIQRLCVLRVLHESEAHVQKLINVDEFTRKLVSVIYSNDSTARAITLRCVGAVAHVLPDKRSLQHRVQTALSSRDVEEAQAALSAAASFCRYSSEFAESMCGRLREVLANLATPPELKLGMIDVLQHMIHSRDLIQQARSILEELLLQWPASEFRCAVIKTCTRLCLESGLFVPEHVELCLRESSTSRARSVRTAARKSLRQLARSVPLSWSAENVMAICSEASKTSSTEMKITCLKLLCSLAASLPVLLSDDLSALTSLARCKSPDNTEHAAVAAHLSAELIAIRNRTKITSELQYVSRQIDMALQLVVCSDQPATPLLKEVLSAVCRICEVTCDEPDFSLVNILSTVYMSAMCESRWVSDACLDCLKRIGDCSSTLLLPLMPALISISGQTLTDTQRLGVCTLLLQLQCANKHDDVTAVVLRLAVSHDQYWCTFRIARQAMRYSQHEIAHRLLSCCVDHVEAGDPSVEWLRAMSCITAAEATLTSGATDLQLRAQTAADSYTRAQLQLKATQLDSVNDTCQLQFCRLRQQLLTAAVQLLAAVAAYRTCPPSAVAIVSKQPALQCAHLIAQTHKCMLALRQLSTGYASLIRRCFDADDSSLSLLRRLELICSEAASIINSILISSPYSSSRSDDRHTTDTVSGLLRSVLQQLSSVAHRAAKPSTDAALTHVHVAALKNLANILICLPLPFPRYFFQILRKTRIRVELSPRPRAPGESLQVLPTALLCLRLDAVIETRRGDQPTATPRNVKYAHVSARTELLSTLSTSSTTDTKPEGNSCTEQQVRVTPSAGFFTTSLALPLPSPGTHRVSIEIELEDESGSRWVVGEAEQFTARTLEHPTKDPRPGSRPPTLSRQTPFNS